MSMVALIDWMKQETYLSLPAAVLPLYALSLLWTVPGFYRVVYFVSIGYAYSISALALATGALFWNGMHPLVALQLVVLFVYGVRLGTYILLRERKSAYKRELEDVKKRGTGVGVGKKFLIWLSVPLLYVFMFSPALFNARTSSTTTGGTVVLSIGVLVMLLGLGIETLADRQKAAFKKTRPQDFCDVGLYRWVRCPNYLGEILVWVGNFVCAIAVFDHGLQWGIAAVGLLCIVLIMMGSTKRLESKQDERYGDREDFVKYRATTPVLLPFVPLYSLKNVRVFLE